jgi:hypothetical protein
VEKTAMRLPWKTPRPSPPAFPTFPPLRRRLRELKLNKLVVLSRKPSTICLRPPNCSAFIDFSPT